MPTKWVPVSGDFLCPGNILLTADEKGIVIKRGSKALATTEWPGDNIRVCELVEEEDTPRPDWSSAPDWSTWWTVDPNGYECWYQEEPILSLTISYSGWIPQTLHGVQLGNMLWGADIDIPLGIDWRLLKEKRPA